MFSYLEKLVDPYPDAPPKSFGSFISAATAGTRRYIALMTLFTAVIGAFEAVLFAMLARVLDWLAAARPQTFWQEHGGTLALLALVLVGSIAVAGLHGIEKNLRLTAKPITGTNVGGENIPHARRSRAATRRLSD